LTVARLGLSLAQETQEDVGGSWRALGIVAAQLKESIDIDDKMYDAAACFAESLRVFTEMRVIPALAGSVIRRCLYLPITRITNPLEP